LHCTTNLLETLEILTKWNPMGFLLIWYILIFLKAFDMVSHRRLLHKLKGYDVKDLLKSLLVSGNRVRLEVSNCERDLGVLISSDWKINPKDGKIILTWLDQRLLKSWACLLSLVQMKNFGKICMFCLLDPILSLSLLFDWWH
jgi:hypothetical protein